MRRGDHLAALSTFPQWCAFNDAQLRDIVLTSESGKGNYFKATRDLSNDEDNAEPPVLLTVPKDLVLSAEALQQYAKVDQNFRDIYDAVGHPVIIPRLCRNILPVSPANQIYSRIE